MIRDLFQISLLVGLLFVSFVSAAQDSTSSKKHFIYTDPEFFQVKDGFNYGLVFNGINLGAGYTFEKVTSSYTLAYTTGFAFGADFKKGVGMNWNFRPVDLSMRFKVDQNRRIPVNLGPYVMVDYNWQLYPELQSGHMFWFSSMELGASLGFQVPVKERTLKFGFTNSIAGFGSRPVPGTETHFYTLDFKSFFRNAHSNLTFGSYNLFDHTTGSLDVISQKGKRFSFGYRIEYFGYYKEPQLSYISHAVSLKWRVGKNSGQ
ncbi:MAG: hypothetical protein GY751_15550 [Bacteroidetes bacterium]|nr:hypothetical protein [Bacteroidota bacterium]